MTKARETNFAGFFVFNGMDHLLLARCVAFTPINVGDRLIISTLLGYDLCSWPCIMPYRPVKVIHQNRYQSQTIL